MTAGVAPVSPAPRPPGGALDPFIPAPDARESFAVTVRAPAALVFEVAAGFDLQSLPLVRLLFSLRARMLGSSVGPRRPQGLLAEMRELGWACLTNVPGELYVAGAVCQPWMPDVVFRPIPAGAFAAFREPDQVKIAWTLEARATSPVETRLATETRAVATDAAARARFRRYWRWARFGIIPIRWFLLPAIRREAERRWRREAARG